MEEIFSKKIKIKELSEYYIRRYKFNANAKAEIEYDPKTYIVAITRILKSTILLDEKNLWDMIKNPKAVRQISIEEFERYCFPRWSEYIEKNLLDNDGFPNYDVDTLTADKRRYNLTADNEKWEKITDDVIEAYNSAFVLNDMIPSDNDPVPLTTEEEVKKKGLEMMIEAIYDIFYKAFDWELLKHDLEAKEITDPGFNPNITPETLKARERLKSFRSYIGEAK